MKKKKLNMPTEHVRCWPHTYSAHLRAHEKAGMPAANSDFVPFVGDPRECKGYVATPPTWAPEKAGVS